MNRRFRASYKIALGFVALAALTLYGYPFANDLLLGRDHFPALKPGSVNILGLDTTKGYQIIVENRAAKLIFAGSDKFSAGDMGERDLENNSGDKKFIPIKDMLKALQGNLDNLGAFVERLNEIKDQDQSPNAPVWKVEDIQKATSGDKALATKLVKDLGVNLDGSPVDRISGNSYQNGILVDYPVPIVVHGVSMVARVKRSYMPTLLRTVNSHFEAKFHDMKDVAAEYAAEGAAIMNGQTPKEDVVAKLKSFGKDAADLARSPQTILDSISVVINNDQIKDAAYVPIATPHGTAYNLTINLTDEGRKRLWQFTRDRVGDQMLLTVDGVAIAAPKIDHRLSGGQILISNLQDESLAQDAVDTITKRATTTK